jgi:hypothetical protein
MTEKQRNLRNEAALLEVLQLAPRNKGLLFTRLVNLGLGETCGRCGGTGSHSYCQAYGSTCFKCSGSGFQSPRFTDKLVAKARELVADGTLERYLEHCRARGKAKRAAGDWHPHGPSLRLNYGKESGRPARTALTHPTKSWKTSEQWAELAQAFWTAKATFEAEMRECAKAIVAHPLFSPRESIYHGVGGYWVAELVGNHRVHYVTRSHWGFNYGVYDIVASSEAEALWIYQNRTHNPGYPLTVAAQELEPTYNP